MKQEHQIINAPSLTALNETIGQQLAQGWRCNGSPFRDDGRTCWCMSMTREDAPTAGEVRIKEPQKSKGK